MAAPDTAELVLFTNSKLFSFILKSMKMQTLPLASDPHLLPPVQTDFWPLLTQCITGSSNLQAVVMLMLHAK